MKKISSTRRAALFAALAMFTVAGWFASAQFSRLGTGKNFMIPEYYESSNGVSRLKTKFTGTEWRFVTNDVVALDNLRIEKFREDGKTLEWTVESPACTFNTTSKEANGGTNVYFRTADERLYQTGRGFSWQPTNSLLILSNDVYTWIDKQALTNAPTNKSTNR